MTCDAGSMSCAVLTGDQFIENLSIQASDLIQSEFPRESNLLQSFKGSWEDDKASVNVKNNHHYNHVTKMPVLSASSKSGRRSLEQLYARVQHKLFTLERILDTKQHSHTAKKRNTSYDRCSDTLAISPSLSTIDREVQRILWLAEKQRQLESSRSELQSSPNAPGCNSSPSTTTPSTISAIYRKLYHRFLARKILRRRSTIHNRRTFIKLVEDDIIEASNTDHEWVAEPCVEKVQRTLKAKGIEMAHTPLTWKEQQFIESNKLGRYGCFRPSFLRWSWTVVGDEGCPD